MKIFLMRLTLAVAIVFVASVAAPPAYTQQDQGSMQTAPRKSDSAAVPSQHANEAQMPASGETTTQEAKAFRGNVVKDNGSIVLQDPVTKVTYKLDDPGEAKQYLGKRVKISGKLDMNSNTILMENIEPAE